MHNDFKLLRVTNRGSNAFATVADQQFAVNIPADLRKPNKNILVEVVDGCMEIDTTLANKFEDLEEVGVDCNICSGSYDAEAQSAFTCGNLSRLFNVNLNNFHTAGKDVMFYKSSNNQFFISSLPEALIFTRMATTSSTITAKPADATYFSGKYISFTLKLSYYDK